MSKSTAIEGKSVFTLTVEECKVLTEYFSLHMKFDNMERQQICFREHMDGFAYLKKIGEI